MEKEFPMINIEGTDFVVDVKRLELREKAEPENNILFEDMRDVGNGYTFEYSQKEKNLPGLFNNESIIVKIPEFVILDPIGMAQKYKMADVIGKTDFEVMVDQDALNKRLKKGMLPTIEIVGHTFYADARIDMLRPKDDFLSRGILFSEIDHYFSEEKNAYIIPYDPKKHEFRELDYDKITEHPKELVAVKFPFQRELDPVGWNRRNGFGETEDLKKVGLKLHFKAQTIPWYKTGIDDVIKENLKNLEMKLEINKPSHK